MTWAVIRVVPPDPRLSLLGSLGSRDDSQATYSFGDPHAELGCSVGTEGPVHRPGDPPFTNVPPPALCPLVLGRARCSGCSWGSLEVWSRTEPCEQGPGAQAAVPRGGAVLAQCAPKSSWAGGVPHVVCLLWLTRSPGGWD